MADRSSRPLRALRGFKFEPRVYALFALLAMAFLLGGGSRADIVTLVILRPFAIMILAFGLWTLRWPAVREFRFIVLFAAAVVLAVGIQLVPLPPSWWAALPGRALVQHIDQVAGIPQPWRPITLVPETSWNALFSLAVPLAALVLAIQCTTQELRRLGYLFVGIGIVSAILGWLQLAFGPDSALYFYKVTNRGSAVGLFANRNHHAAFLACMIPVLWMLVVTSAKGARAARPLGLSIVILFFVTLLVAGSRAGLALGIVGFVAAMLLKGRLRLSVARGRGRLMLLGAGGFALLAVAAIAVTYQMPGATLNRLGERGEEMRFVAWGPIFDMAWANLPVGTGAGVFVEPFLVAEPDALLDTTYLNHAHNDWLEVFLSHGAIGVLLLAMAFAAWVRAGVRLWKPSDSTSAVLGKAGLAVIMLMAMSSVVDYPLRVPSLACLFVTAAVWARRAMSELAVRRPTVFGDERGAPLPSQADYGKLS